MVYTMSAKSVWHARPRVMYEKGELSHRCRHFRHVLERSAASPAKHGQGPEVHATAVQTASLFRSDTAVSQSLDRDIAVGMVHCERYGWCVCQDFLSFLIVSTDLDYLLTSTQLTKDVTKPAITSAKHRNLRG